MDARNRLLRTRIKPKLLSGLPDDKRNLRRILGLYLNLKEPFDVDTKVDDLLMRVTGTGRDGEKQIFCMYINGRIYRGYWADKRFQRLPSDIGKVLHMLNEMGYWLYGANLNQANRYRKYMTTGVSNLDKVRIERSSRKRVEET